MLPDSISAAALWDVMPVLVLAWLAVFFGRTLRNGQTPLIERIARVSDPALSPALCRYTRKLTAAWCAYFLVAALWSCTAPLPAVQTGALVWTASLLFFVGEHQLRIHLFPGQAFPGLLQQVRDSWRVWHSGRP